MRPIGRMPVFLKQIQKEWEKVPDWRFGQLMFNFISEYGDPFFLEEDQFVEELQKYLDRF